MNELPKVQAAFGLKFQSQIDFFKQKVRLPTQSYKDISAIQHDKAFVVAGAMKADLLRDLQSAVGRAIEDGESLGAFRKRFASIVEKRGWKDYTGSDSTVGRAWRTRVIYLTNMRTSHAAGRWQQMTTPEMMKARPYWQYRHVTRDNPRLYHQRLNNKVLKADDAWWQVNYPPNGYGCNCYTRTLSQADMNRLGLSVANTPDIDGYTQVGWEHAAGSTWQPNIDKYSFVIAKSMVASSMADGVFERWIGRMQTQKDELKASGNYVGSGLDKNRLIRAQDTGEDFVVAVLSNEQRELLGVQTQTVRLSEYDALKQAISREGNRGFDASSYQKVQRVIDDASLIVRQIHKPTGELSKRTLWVEGFMKDKKSRYSAVLHQTQDGSEIYLKSYRLDSTKDAAIKKRGEVLLER
ncbi:phage head morphogenesis protein [Psychrobacter aquaticus]|uniref:Phage head morphogenesis domain-containing protein n=1 Tax=Psychrobacter aquaticus CMS 56 TaxID=1354303 RepID=U4T5H5_9GAMM|nr:phage minor head protein [Psychrobacter aquaticus]ERL56150.1 hypothetical protein M917_0828 [Psychrobacter aquaticus CMS 56]